MKQKIFILFLIALCLACFVACNSQISYTVNFYNGETLLATKTVEKGESVITPSSPTKTGYTFVGWENNGQIETSKLIQNVKANLTFKAIFKVNQYNLNLTFEKNFGTVTGGENKVVNYGESITLTATANKGYSFGGFSLKNGIVIKSNPYTFNMPSNDLNLTALFYANETFVTFDVDGGSPLASQTFAYDQTIKLPTPTKDEHKFLGWQIGDELLTSTEEILWKHTEATATLKAKWEINKYNLAVSSQSETKGTASVGNIYNIIYNYGEATSTGILTDKSSYGSPLNYNYCQGTIDGSGALFVGWFLNETLATPYNPNDYISSSQTLYAKWLSAQYYLNCNESKTFEFMANQIGSYDVYFSTLNRTSVTFDLSCNRATTIKYTLLDLSNNKLEQGEIALSESNSTLTFDELENGCAYILNIMPRVQTTKTRIVGIRQQKPTDLPALAKFDFNALVAVTATPIGDATFLGWYDGDTLLSTNLVYTFNLTKNTNLVAKWN